MVWRMSIHCVDFQWDEFQYRVLFRRVLEHMKFEYQRAKKHAFKRECRRLNKVNTSLRHTITQQAEMIAALQQTIEKQAQMLEQSGTSPRQASDSFVTSRLRTPSRRRYVKSPATSTPLANVLESPQTQLSRSLAQLGVHNQNHNSDDIIQNSSVLSPGISPSRIPPPPARMREGVCTHGRSPSCKLCLSSPPSKLTPPSKKRTAAAGQNESARKSKEDSRAKLASPSKMRSPPKLRSSSNNNSSNISSESKTKTGERLKTTESKFGTRSNILSIHFEDVQEKPPSHFGPPQKQFMPSLSSVPPPPSERENKETESGSVSYSTRTANLLRAVSTAVRDRRTSR